MSDDTYSLLDEQWIRVQAQDGSVVGMGILDVFRRASRLRRLAGEGPTQDAALLRLLIAILYRALPVSGPPDERAEQWGAWWTQEQLPLEQIEPYLARHRSRFDLFGETPFMQVADLTANKTSGIGKLIADLPDGHQYFTTRSGRETTRLSLDEAARWLVHAHAFDPSGIKTGAHGDPAVKGGKGYPIGTGWSGQCGLLLLEGRTLSESLLLNLVLSRSVPQDCPVWERDPQTAAPDSLHPSATGPADLLTWSARRVRLFRVGDDVVDVLICNGDKLDLTRQLRLEPHVAWRYSDPQSKKFGETVYMPRTHDPDRALWRGLPALLGQADPPTGKYAKKPPPAGVFDWTAALVGAGVLAPEHPIGVRAVGAEYGAQASTIAAMVDDSLVVQASVLRDLELKRVASDAVVNAEHAVRALADLVQNLAAAAGDSGSSGVKEQARQVLYTELDPAYRRWVASLSSESDLHERLKVWQQCVGQVVRRARDRALADAGAPAWRGRPAKVGLRTIDHLDAGLAERWFAGALARALPLTAPSLQTTDAQESR
ncbi:type I-E CRISPR-associated protein Cse1/CasA [Dermacoccaceae bacterium W4C1]